MPVAEPRSIRRANPLGAKKVPKYGNRKTVVDGVTFDSAKEARRYGELKLLERAGEIADLKLQQRFPLVVCGKRICAYVADFTYTEASELPFMDGDFVVEDAKGFRTPEYKLKAKLFEALHGFPIREV